MATYSLIALMSVCVGACFTVLYSIYEDNPIFITIMVLLPIAVGYFNTQLEEDETSIKKVFMNMANILLSFILTSITAMLVNNWLS